MAPVQMYSQTPTFFLRGFFEAPTRGRCLQSSRWKLTSFDDWTEVILQVSADSNPFEQASLLPEHKHLTPHHNSYTISTSPISNTARFQGRDTCISGSISDSNISS